MLNLKDKTVTIIGAQSSGLALADLVIEHQGKVKISDKAEPLSDFADYQSDAIQWEWSQHSEAFIIDADYVVLSPGVRFDSEVVSWAQQHQIPVLGEIEFAYQFCPQKVIAITGSNGKTTVSTLTHQVLAEGGYANVLCGNIGYPFSRALLENSSAEYIVLEMSSFQLESLIDANDPAVKAKDLQLFKPYIALFLNFCENHLDRHKNIEEYFQAKQNIFRNQNSSDHALLNAQDERLKVLSQQLRSTVHLFNEGEVNPNHDAVNQVANIFNISEDVVQGVLDNFKGVEHRLEFVRSFEGVDYINDSKATTAEASRWALDQINQPALMICGGKDKNIDFSVLSDIVRAKVKKIFIFGEATAKIRETFEGVVEVEECSELNRAVLRAKASAEQGDCVILSPMCASFDMFRNYEERGSIYKQIVNEL